MRTYYLIYWDGGSESSMKINAPNEQKLYDKLVQEFPNLDEILLNKFNYNYISNASHWLAAGYMSGIFESSKNDASISRALSPAHFNRNFFYVLGYEEYESVQEIRKKKLDTIDEQN